MLGLSKHNLYIASVVSTYWLVSISMVYLNKLLLSDDKSSIPAPLFVTWYQCILTCVICYILGELGERNRSLGRPSFFDDFPRVKYNTKIGMQVLPLSLIFVAMIAFNNLCLQYVQVSFYNIARSLSIIFSAIFTYLILGKSTSALSCSTQIIVFYGMYLGIEGEMDFSLLGTVAGILASFFVALNSVFTSKVLGYVDNDKSLLLYYNNFNASLLFIPLIVLFESHIIAENLSKLVSLYFWSTMSVTGAMGFGVGLVTVMQVRATSPLTHLISGNAKSAVQSILAFYIWGNEATSKGLIGLFLVVLGSAMYTLVQMNAPVLPAGSDKK